MYRQKENSGARIYLLDHKFIETPNANLRPIVKLSKLGSTRTHDVRDGVRLMRDALKEENLRLNDK